MKRVTSLLLAMALVVGSISAAKADGVDIKVQGQWDFAFIWQDNVGFRDSTIYKSKSRNDDRFMARQRVRTQINFIVSESLQGVLFFEIGNTTWGRNSDDNNTGGRLDADGVNIKTRRAYLDWIIPTTEVAVRMGIQGLTLPNAMGNPVFDADVAGVVVSSPITEYLSIAGFWIRPFDAYINDVYDDYGSNRSSSIDDEVDIFGLMLPIHGEGWAVTPWGMYGRIGNGSGLYGYMFGDRFGGTSARGDVGSNWSTYEADTASAWWGGLNFEFTMWDPLSFKMDAIYGRINKNDLEGVGPFSGLNTLPSYDIGTKGWFIAAALDYKLDWGTPGIFGWWSTGDRESKVKDGWLGRIPVIGTDQGFQPTTFGFPGSYSNGLDGAIASTGAGTWGIGAQLADLSFIEDLTHTLRVAYYRGTNDEDIVRKGMWLPYDGANQDWYLTKKDSVWEVNFDHKYQIYENLAAVLELGYLHLKADESVWGRWDNRDETDNAWRAQLIFQYKF